MTSAPLSSEESAKDGDEAWRRSVIQAVPIPDLSHTGIKTAFDYQATQALSPDGNVTREFREIINHRMRSCTIVPDEKDQDMSAKDYKRTVRRYRKGVGGASPLMSRMSLLEGDGQGNGGLGNSDSALTSGSSVSNKERHHRSVRLAAFRQDLADLQETNDPSFSREKDCPWGQARQLDNLPRRKRGRKKKATTTAALLGCLLDLAYEKRPEEAWDLQGLPDSIVETTAQNRRARTPLPR